MKCYMYNNLFIFLISVIFYKHLGFVNTSAFDGVSCGYHEFRCKNGQCIPLEWKCDGMVDCGINDTSDEDNCDNKDLCELEPWNYFRCIITRRCISNHFRCDGKPDCLYGDWSDENNCL